MDRACRDVLSEKYCRVIRDAYERIKREFGGKPFDCSAFPNREQCKKDFATWMKTAYEHLEANISWCDIVCVSLEFQGGSLQVVAGVGPVPGLGGNIVWQSLPYEEQGSLGFSPCGSWYVGLCGGAGPKVDASGEWTGLGWSAGVAFGFSETRPMLAYTVASVNVHTGTVTSPQDPLPPSLYHKVCDLSWFC